MRKVIIFLIAVLIGFILEAGALGEGVWVQYYGTGNDYIKVDESGRTNYIYGVFDGLQLGSALDKVELSLFKEYVYPMRIPQIKAIVDKHMKENPEKWHQPMASLVYSALREARQKESNP